MAKPAFNVAAKIGRQDGEGKDMLVHVGAAWENQKRTGYNVKLDTLPVDFDGFLYLTPPKEDDAR